MLFFGFQGSAGRFLITVVLLCVIEMASSAQSRLLSWSPDDDDDYEGGFNQDDADDDIDDDVYYDVDDGVKAHDVSHLRLLSPAPLSLEPRISLPTSFLSRPIVLGRTFWCNCSFFLSFWLPSNFFTKMKILSPKTNISKICWGSVWSKAAMQKTFQAEWKCNRQSQVSVLGDNFRNFSFE